MVGTDEILFSTLYSPAPKESAVRRGPRRKKGHRRPRGHPLQRDDGPR